MQLTQNDLEDLARGAAFLGTGGGGDPYLGRLAVSNAIKIYGQPRIIDLHELEDDDMVYAVGGMGSPMVELEKIPGGPEVALALSELEQYTGNRATAIIPCEMGGSASMMPIQLALECGLPLVNADGMGRAFPQLEMTSFAVKGFPACPLNVVNEHGDSCIINTSDDKQAEGIARMIVNKMGGSAVSCSNPMTGAATKDSAIANTLAIALGIGRAINEGRQQNDPIESLLEYLRTTEYYQHCKVIFDGKVTDLKHVVKEGFSIGSCELTALGKSRDKMVVMFQNENLVAKVNGQTKAIVPDLICMVDRETGEPITNETLRFGLRVKVLAVSAPSIMRSAAALKLFGPKVFGLDEPFQAIENIT